MNDVFADHSRDGWRALWNLRAAARDVSLWQVALALALSSFKMAHTSANIEMAKWEMKSQPFTYRMH